MAKKPGPSLTLSGSEQGALRTLLALRDQANASAAAINQAVRGYLLALLQGRGLDPQKWGITPDMTTFCEVQQPPAPAPAGQSASAGQPPAAVPAPAPEPAAQPFAESSPAPAPADDGV